MIGGDWQAFFDVWITVLARASLHGAIAISLVWIVCRMFPRLPPNVRCWLWRLALLKMLLALFPLTSLDLAILPSSWPESPTKVESFVPSSSVVENQNIQNENAQNLAPTVSDSKPQTDHSTDLTDAASPYDKLLPEAKKASLPWGLAFLCAIWLAIVAGFLGLLLKHIRTARRSRDQWQLIKDHDILTINERLAGRMRLFQPPVLFQSESCPSPVVFGAVRTAIILPSSLVSKSVPDEIALILAHEMAHIRRWDLLGNWLSTMVSTLFFFHPLVWLALRECWLAEEMACDELAVRQSDTSVADYGRLLVDLAARFQRVGLPVVTVGVTESFPMLLKRRLFALKTFGTRSRGVLALSWSIAIIAMLGLLPWRLVAASNQSDVSPLSTLSTHDRAAVPQDEKGPDKECIDSTIDIQTAVGPFLVSADRLRVYPDKGFRFASVPSGLPLTPKDLTKEWGTGYFQPNLILDLLVRGPKTNDKHQWICNVIGSVRVSDDQGQACKAPDQKGILRLQMRDVDYPEGDGRATIHLRLPPESLKAKQLRSVEGTLIIAEGQVHRIVFDEKDIAKLTRTKPGEKTLNPLKKEYTSSSGKVAVFMTDFDRVSDGFNVLLAIPWSPDPKIAEGSSKYHWKKLLNAYSQINLVLHDSLGKTHKAGYCTDIIEGRGPTISVCDGNLRITMGPWSSMPSYPCALKRFNSPTLMHQFHFDPLPDGVTVKSLTCTITECVGPSQMIPFHLKGIPLPQ